MMENKLKFLSFISVLILLYFVVGYRYYLHLFDLPFLIILTTYLFYQKKWKYYLGLNISKNSLIMFLILTPILSFICYFLTLYILPKNIYLDKFNFKSVFFTFGQCLSEEMVLRALILSPLIMGYYPKKKVFLYAVIPSLLFSFLHYIVVKYSFKFNGLISFYALLTIFFFSLSTNLLYTITRNIMLPLAIHFGWNLVRFGLGFIYDPNNPMNRVPEYISFNFLEGSTVVLSFSFFYCLLVTVLFFFDWNINNRYKIIK